MKKILLLLGSLVVLMSSLAFAQGILIKTDHQVGLNDPDLYISLGDFLIENGYSEAAISVYQKALSISPNNKAVFNNLGLAYKNLNPLLAEEYFLKALEIDSGYEAAQNNLALLYNELGYHEKAAQVLRKLTSLFPNNVHYNYDLAINLGNKLRIQGGTLQELNEAINYFKIAHNLHPGFQNVIENLRVLQEIKRSLR